MTKESGAQIQIAVRMPEAWLPRLDALAEALSRPGIEVSRSDVIRGTIARGLQELEAEVRGPKAKR